MRLERSEHMKKYVKIIFQFLLICLFYQVGVLIQETFHLFIPGSIIGMSLLFLLLMTKVIQLEWVEAGGHVLLRYLPMLFLPATIGIINYPFLLSFQGFKLIFIVIMSSILVFLISGKTAQILAQKRKKDGEHRAY